LQNCFVAIARGIAYVGEMKRALTLVVLTLLGGCSTLLSGDPITNCRVAANCNVVETKAVRGPPHQRAIEPMRPDRRRPSPAN
jgi:hypothetical protein